MRSAVRTHLDEYPYRLEAGTMNMLGISGLYRGVKWIEEKGIQNIHDQEMKLWKRLVDGVRNVEGVTVYCATSVENQNPVLSLNVRGFEAMDVGTMLDVDYDIACRTGLQCAPLVHERIGTLPVDGTVRLSVGAFNTEEEIDVCINAIKEIAALKN